MDCVGALRIEPNVRLAVLFGSFATGADAESSDVDLLVVLGDSAPGVVAALSGRLADRLGRDVLPVRLQEAEQSPALMLNALADGRVVDRERLWPRLKALEPFGAKTFSTVSGTATTSVAPAPLISVRVWSRSTFGSSETIRSVERERGHGRGSAVIYTWARRNRR